MSESGPISGDPDSSAEGVVNVDNGWNTGGTTEPDTTAPTGEITEPAGGSTVSGTVTVSSDSADSGSGVASAQFQYLAAGASSWVDIGTDTQGADGYSVDWDTAVLADGNYDLRVTTSDNDGNSYTSLPVTVSVQNTTATDTTPPTVSLTAPPDGDILVGSVLFSANADDGADGSGVASVAFQALADSGTTWIDLGTSANTASPYTLNVDTTTLTDGTYTVQAVATDNGGNLGSSATVTVTVDNVADPAPTAPTAPSDLTANPKGRGIRLNWVDNSTNELGFYIYRDDLGAVPLATVPADTTTFRDETAVAGTTYTYAVSAYNAGGESSATSITVTEQ
ncbi:MAG: fibronectin type III domain-containing protein [Chloroflexota bacterium]|nr:fibronectin type III domain-containing protein [Chloroflexota bacterium]